MHGHKTATSIVVEGTGRALHSFRLISFGALWASPNAPQGLGSHNPNFQFGLCDSGLSPEQCDNVPLSRCPCAFPPSTPAGVWGGAPSLAPQRFPCEQCASPSGLALRLSTTSRKRGQKGGGRGMTPLTPRSFPFQNLTPAHPAYPHTSRVIAP